jgi:hypothetical protein
MELPDDVLKIIREYSKPVTHPNWRLLSIMPSFHFHASIAYSFNKSLHRKMNQSLYELIIFKESCIEYDYCIELYEGLPYIECIYSCSDDHTYYIPY